MAYTLNNKIVAVTGGADGIGFQIAYFFLKSGANTVIILDINEEKGSKAVQKLISSYGDKAADFFNCDVTQDLESVYKAMVDKYENIDILVNCAGISSADHRKVIAINLIAVMEWTSKFYDHMREDQGGKGGTIMNIASVYGFQKPKFITQGTISYVASKHGVIGLTKCFGEDNNDNLHGVRVVALCPGFAKTEINRRLWDDGCIDRGIIWQDAEVVGKAAVDTFEIAESGTAWIINSAKPIEQLRYYATTTTTK